MVIRDRSKIKWAAAFLQPEQAKLQQDFWQDTEWRMKPIIDDHEAEEFDLRIIYSMEFNQSVKLTIWDDGFTQEITGRIHYVAPITKELRIEVKPGEFHSIVLSELRSFNLTEIKIVSAL